MALICGREWELLDAPVPSCPGWTVADLVDHLTTVFEFWRTQAERADPTAPAEPDPGGASNEEGAPVRDFEGLASASASLVEALSTRDPTDACWNWWGRELNIGWVARRMALETVVHRCDCDLGAGELAVVDRRLALDGIDERIAVHLDADLPEHPEATLGGLLCLACTDDPAAWTVEVARGSMRWRPRREPADAVLSGTASELFLFTWNRVALAHLVLTGQHQVAEAWASLPV